MGMCTIHIPLVCNLLVW